MFKSEYCFVNEMIKNIKEKNISIEYCEVRNGLRKRSRGNRKFKNKSVKVASAMHKGSYDNILNVFNFCLNG